MPPLGQRGPLDDEVRWDEQDWLPDDETSIREADALGSPGAALALGLLLHQRGDLEGADDCFRRADSRGSADAACYVGALLQDRGHAQEALAAYHRADGRGSAEGAWSVGAVMQKKGDLLEAEAAYRRADERGSARGAVSLGALLWERGDMEGAQAACRRADERGSAAGAAGLASLLAWRGDLQGAEGALHRADERGSREAALQLGRLLLDRGDREAAEVAFNRADERGDAEAGRMVGELRHRRGDTRGAEGPLRRADARGDARAAWLVGEILSARGDMVAAEAAYRRASLKLAGAPAGPWDGTTSFQFGVRNLTLQALPGFTLAVDLRLTKTQVPNFFGALVNGFSSTLGRESELELAGPPEHAAVRELPRPLAAVPEFGRRHRGAARLDPDDNCVQRDDHRERRERHGVDAPLQRAPQPERIRRRPGRGIVVDHPVGAGQRLGPDRLRHHPRRSGRCQHHRVPGGGCGRAHDRWSRTPGREGAPVVAPTDVWRGRPPCIGLASGVPGCEREVNVRRVRTSSEEGRRFGMPVIDDLVRQLRDHEVGLWCKRAAWLIAIVNTALVLFQLIGILTHTDLATLPVALLTAVLGYVVTTLWYFFVLYALGAIVDRLADSRRSSSTSSQ